MKDCVNHLMIQFLVALGGKCRNICPQFKLIQTHCSIHDCMDKDPDCNCNRGGSGIRPNKGTCNVIDSYIKCGQYYEEYNSCLWSIQDWFYIVDNEVSNNCYGIGKFWTYL